MGNSDRSGPDGSGVAGPETAIDVLHVDDDPEFAELTATALERAGEFSVQTAAGASEGSQRLAEGSFDCVVSDYEMGERDGIEFLRAVRDERPDLPFILFTGKGSETVASEAIEAGVTGYLQKESGLEQYTILANRIRNAVGKRRAHDNYRELFEKIGDGVKIHDPETYELLDVNQRFCEMHGYPRERMLEMSVEEYTASEFTQADARARIDRATNGEPQVFETVNETSDGEALPVEVRLVGTQIDGRDRVLAVVRDITERRERERQLEEATDRTELALSGSDSWLWDWNVDADTVVQSAVSGLLDVPEGSVERDIETFIEEIHPEDREEFRAARRRAVGGTGDYHAEFRLDLPGGDRWIESRGEVYRGGAEDPDRIIGIATDVTERKHRERERAWMQDLLDRAEESVFIADSETATVEYVNDTACDRLGYDRAELLGATVSDIQPELSPDAEWEEYVGRLRATDGAVTFEGEHVRRDGSSYPVEIKAGVLEDATEEYVFSVARDITHRKERERELERQNERLEEFAQTVSHDLRTPLGVASGSIELAAETGDPDHLERAQGALERMDELLEDLLALARKGQTVAEPTPVELGDLARSAWENVDTGGAELTVDIEGTVLADGQRLRELFENLYRNSVEHGGSADPDGDGAPLRVRVGGLDERGFFVEDDGPGVPAEDRGRLFEWGYTTAEDGTGLGLAIVEQIAGAHGWTVQIEDGADGGARFVFTGVERVADPDA